MITRKPKLIGHFRGLKFWGSSLVRKLSVETEQTITIYRLPKLEGRNLEQSIYPLFTHFDLLQTTTTTFMSEQFGTALIRPVSDIKSGNTKAFTMVGRSETGSVVVDDVCGR